MFKEERIGGLQSGNKDKKAKRDENIGRHGLRLESQCSNHLQNRSQKKAYE